MAASLGTEPLDATTLGAAPARRSAATWLHEHRWQLALWLLAVVVGIAMRRWILATSLGTADLDEATVGVQAGLFNDGDRSAFFLNQAYGGTIETQLVAWAFAAFGSSVTTLKVVPMVLAAVAALLSGQIAKELGLGRLACWCVPILVWCGPAYSVLFSTKERGFYGVALVLAAAYPVLVLRLAREPSVRDAVVLGACVGLGWWQTPLTLAVAVPAVLWLVCVRPTVIERLWWAIPAAAVAALPWIVWNTENGWASVEPASSFGTTWWDRFFDWLARQSVVLGTETPFDASRRLIDNRWVGLVLLAVVLAIATKRTNWEAPWFLVTMVVGYGTIYAANPLAAGVGVDPRYTYLMVPIVATALAALLPDPERDATRFAAGLGVLALVTASSAWGLAGARAASDREHPNLFLSSPGIEEVAELLQERGVTAAITDTAGMQLAFLTDGEVVGASFSVPRSDTYEVLARVAERSTYVLDEELVGNADLLRLWLVANDVGFEEHDIGKWRVFLIDGRVLPEQVGMLTFGGRLR